MEFKGCQGIARDSKRLQRNLNDVKDFKGFQWISRDSNEFLGISRDFIGFQGFSRIFKGNQGTSRECFTNIFKLNIKKVNKCLQIRI